MTATAEKVMHPGKGGGMKEQWVVVTTEHKGVFFGRLEGKHTKAQVILRDCLNAMYWAGDRGFLGLASHGPSAESRIGATAPEVVLYDITSVSACTPRAVDVWRAWPCG